MYAVLGPDGNLEEIEETVEAAVEEAYSLGAREVLIDSSPEGPSRQVNQQDVTVRKAHKQMGGIVIPRSAMGMSRDEMWDRLHRFFPSFTYAPTEKDPAGRVRDIARTSRVESGATSKAVAATSLVNAILGQNAKTGKKKGMGRGVDVQGLSLTPYWQYQHVTVKGLPMATAEKHPTTPNFCVGSSEACRHSCLVFSGQNYLDDYNVAIKFRRTQAFLEEPEAFGKLLYEAALSHYRNAPKPKNATKKHEAAPKGFIPMVRLNVFQDIPWEVVMPWFFEELPDLQMYDYTKVFGRKVPDNYDLTFSNSGGNLRLVNDSLDQGTRVALVAHVPGWTHEFRHRKGETDRQYEARRHAAWVGALPAECRGFPVIDGDESDVRPLDPAPSVVALRWKSPRGQAASRSTPGLQIGKDSKFVVEVQDFCGLWAGAVTPGTQSDTVQRTVFSEVPLVANPGGRRLFQRQANPGAGSPDDLVRRLKF
jgi:hypothetical protein